jgi:hypothetical protein
MSSKAKHAQRSHKSFNNHTQVFRDFESRAYHSSVISNSKNHSDPTLPMLLLAKFATLFRRRTGK